MCQWVWLGLACGSKEGAYIPLARVAYADWGWLP
jgi:hypothetical protein